MNKRAKTRLIAVSAVILIVGIAMFSILGTGGGVYSYKVSQIPKDLKPDTRIQVAGKIVDGSWDGKTNPIKFVVQDDPAMGTPKPGKITIVYNGSVPNTFGNGVVVMATGAVDKDGVLQANEMITKCPSKYKTSSGPS